jgi:threonine aldolase
VSVSDFRSDTVTRPTPAMRAAMCAAEVGDDVLDGDPTVRRLEEQVARLLGKDGALFTPSGTMANQIALGAWTRPGDEIVAERSAHIVGWESGAAGFNHGVQTMTLHAEDGALDPAEVRRVIRPRNLDCPRTALLCLEQTFTGSGTAAAGRVVPLARLRELHALARELGIPVHLDGARLWNAVVAARTPASEWAACADSVSVCISKGLGAPVGSLIAGPKDFLERARLVRKRLGGMMRQSGILAAAGLYALEHHVERLAQDHALARRVAFLLERSGLFECPPAEIETNVVMARLRSMAQDAPLVSAALRERGVLVSPWSPRALRFVTHLDLHEADLERLERALGDLTHGGRAAARA